MAHAVSVAVDLANIFAVVALIVIDFAAVKLFFGRGRRARGLILVPVLGIAGAASQLFYVPARTLVWASGLIVLGLVMYALREILTLKRQHIAIRSVIRAKASPLVAVLRRV